jgi:hypothetical protein
VGDGKGEIYPQALREQPAQLNRSREVEMPISLIVGPSLKALETRRGSLKPNSELIGLSTIQGEIYMLRVTRAANPSPKAEFIEPDLPIAGPHPRVPNPQGELPNRSQIGGARAIIQNNGIGGIGTPNHDRIPTSAGGASQQGLLSLYPEVQPVAKTENPLR